MKFALWGMKHFENSLRWIQREANYWMTWVSFLNLSHLQLKGVLLSVYEEGPKHQGQFLLSEPCPFEVTFWARGLCQLHCHLCDSYLGAVCVPSLHLGLPWRTTAAKYITVLLGDRKCPDATPSHYLSPLVISSPLYSIVLFLPSKLFS